MSSEPEIELRALLSAAEGLRPSVERTFLVHPIFLQSHVRLTSRIKSISRAAAKLAQIRIEKQAAAPADVPDLMGLRIVALYNSSLVEALDAVLDSIGREHSPFDRDHVKMLTYTARPDTDPLSLKHSVEEWAQTRGITHASEPTPTLYSSVHVNAVCPVTIEMVDGTRQSRLLQVEVQVRTAMEDVWSQLSHVVAYTRHPANPTILGHLNALKQVFDGCALYVDLIKNEADATIQNLKEGSDSPKSAGDQPLRQIKGIPSDIISAFDAAVRQRNAASELDDELSSHEFLDAAMKFAGVEEQLRDSEELPTTEKAEAIYRTQMEHAFCLLYSYTIPGLEDAYAMYDALAKADPNDAVCRLRLSQALRRKGEIPRAKSTLMEAIRILDGNLDQRVDAKNWVRGRVHEELANANWLIYSSEADQEGKRESLSQAISEARTAVAKYRVTSESESNLLGAINNLLYFAWEELRVYKVGSTTKQELERLASELSLKKIRALLPAHKWDAFFDTSLKTSAYLGRNSEILEIATATMDSIDAKVRRRSGKGSDYTPDYTQRQRTLTADEMDTYLYAVEMASRAARDLSKFQPGSGESSGKRRERNRSKPESPPPTRDGAEGEPR
jgi:ppGpp synthetase/RelA/SpoT-type nucleotidyltranferase